MLCLIPLHASHAKMRAMPRIARTLWLLALLSLVPRPVLAQRRAEVDRVLALAAKEAAGGSLESARRRLRPLLARGSDDARVALQYLRLTLPLDDATPYSARVLELLTKRAREVLSQLSRVTLAPDHDENARLAALHVAWAAALVGRYDESLAAVRTAGRLQDAPTLSSLRLVASAAARRERLDVAEQALRMGRELVPQDVTAMAELARVLLARGRAHEAVSILTERLTVTPDDLEARRDLAYARTAAGRAREGLSVLTHVRAACELSPDCSLEAARIALEAGLPDDAAGFAARQLERAPDDLEALYVRADAQAERGLFAEARETWRRVLSLRPDNLRARQALAQLPP